MDRTAVLDDSREGSQEGQAKIFPQVRCALTASIGLFISGTIIAWTGTTLTKMDADFKMAATEYSLVVSLTSYGSLFGCLFAGKGMDLFGRRKLMLGFAPLTACGWLVIGFATNVYMVYVGRTITGFCSGVIYTSASIYTSETCQPSLRGRLGSLPPLSLAFGVLTSFVVGGCFSWQTSAFLCIVPTLALFISFYLVPESPYWYLLKENNTKASKSLKRLLGSDINIACEIKQMTHRISKVGVNLSYKEILHRRTLLPLAVALFMQTLQQFTGGDTVNSYTSSIFEMAESSVDSNMATIYVGVAQVIGTIISIFLIDKYGRRFLLIMSVILCGIFISLLGTYFLTLRSPYVWPRWLPLVILAAYFLSYCLGCVTIPFLIGSEVFNTSIRSRANSIVMFYNRVVNIAVVQVYPYAVSSLGEGIVFLSLGVMCAAFVVGTLLFVPETKGRSLEQIQEYFEHKASNSKAKDTHCSLQTV